jgi:hypothetical protein
VDLPTAPPSADALAGLDAALWRRVLVHARHALAEAAESDPDPRVVRLAGFPAGRLASGRARRDLQAALADGGVVWLALRRRILDDADLGRDLAAALAGGSGSSGAPVVPSLPAVDDPDRTADLQDRLRQARSERDEARRRADGEAARADREAARAAELQAQVDRLQAEVAALQQDVERANRERGAAVDRERRRGEAALADVRDELRVLRREQDDRARRARAAEQARAATPPPGPDPAPTATGLEVGRPSRLPPEVHIDTTEAAELLLHPGRLVLVDGYNVTRTHQANLDLEAQRQWLVNLLANAAAARRIDPVVVFDAYGSDGPGSSRRDRRVTVTFTGADISADDDLVFRVDAADANQPIVVVTDDAELRDRLAPYGVDLLHTLPFLGAVR